MILPGFPDAMPVEGFIGGLLIGLAAALMLIGGGRIAGISGIAARALALSKSDLPIPLAWLFLLGLLIGVSVIHTLAGPIESTFPDSIVLLMASGLIVGFGTRMGSGCTSGHGVCGMSRLSPRSLLATIIFIASGMITVMLTNLWGANWW